MSLSPLLTDDDIDNALVAAMNIAIELFFGISNF
jgi:hypothetical protein